ncbi:MAG: metal-dependent hydrolase [Actinomycetota bacterium]
MFFWHVGATIAFVRYAFRDEDMDLRFLALGAILPDLVDSPIAAAMWTDWQAPRLASHSLLFGSILMAIVLVGTRRGDRRKRWMLLATGVLMHLALDAMWSESETLWWPFLGWEFTNTPFGTFGGYATSVFTDPWMWAGEVVGLVYLTYLWMQSGLGRSENRRALLETGRVSAPIELR